LGKEGGIGNYGFYSDTDVGSFENGWNASDIGNRDSERTECKLGCLDCPFNRHNFNLEK